MTGKYHLDPRPYCLAPPHPAHTDPALKLLILEEALEALRQVAKLLKERRQQEDTGCINTPGVPLPTCC